jgi:hypothetical protein
MHTENGRKTATQSMVDPKFAHGKWSLIYMPTKAKDIFITLVVVTQTQGPAPGRCGAAGTRFK